MTKYIFSLNIGFSGSKHEEEFDLDDLGKYTEEEWAEMSNSDKEKILRETWEDWSSNYIDGGWRLK